MLIAALPVQIFFGEKIFWLYCLRRFLSIPGCDLYWLFATIFRMLQKLNHILAIAGKPFQWYSIPSFARIYPGIWYQARIGMPVMYNLYFFQSCLYGTLFRPKSNR